jgi:membrane fusion protein, multidrug efflux system
MWTQAMRILFPDVILGSASPSVRAALLLATFAIGGCGHKAPPKPPPPSVQFVIVHSQALTLTIDLPGRTVAYRTAEIRPQISGIVQKRMFVEGSDVKAGQQLYQIDPSLYRATLDSATAMASASAALVERYRPLEVVQAVSRQDFDNAVASAAQSKAATETATINLVYTRLLSPISGRIGRSAVTEGALVTANQAVTLATVQQLDPIYVDVSQPSAVLLRLKREFAAGQLQHAGDNQAEVHLTLEDGSEYPHTGRLEFTEVSVDATTGSVTLRAVFPNPDRLLLPGMFVHERLAEGQRSDALLAPQQGVSRGPTGDATAMLVGRGDKIEVRKIKTDRAIGDQWLVTEGLKDGDRVVVEGLQKVKADSVVQPEEVKTATSGAAPAAKVAKLAPPQPAR